MHCEVHGWILAWSLNPNHACFMIEMILFIFLKRTQKQDNIFHVRKCYYLQKFLMQQN
jgi:hypothetical protein